MCVSRHGSFVTAHSSLDMSGSELVVLASCGDIEEIRRVLKHGVSVDATNFKGETALMEAAYKGHAEVCGMLLESKANIWLVDHPFKNTALLWAAIAGHAEACRVLLDLLPASHGRSCLLEVRNINRHTALMEAALGNHTEACELLAVYGADISKLAHCISPCPKVCIEAALRGNRRHLNERLKAFLVGAVVRCNPTAMGANTTGPSSSPNTSQRASSHFTQASIALSELAAFSELRCRSELASASAPTDCSRDRGASAQTAETHENGGDHCSMQLSFVQSPLYDPQLFRLIFDFLAPPSREHLARRKKHCDTSTASYSDTSTQASQYADHSYPSALEAIPSALNDVDGVGDTGAATDASSNPVSCPQSSARKRQRRRSVVELLRNGLHRRPRGNGDALPSRVATLEVSGMQPFAIHDAGIGAENLTDVSSDSCTSAAVVEFDAAQAGHDSAEEEELESGDEAIEDDDEMLVFEEEESDHEAAHNRQSSASTSTASARQRQPQDECEDDDDDLSQFIGPSLMRRSRCNRR